MRLNEVLRRVKVSSRLADESLQQAEAWKVEAEDWKVKAEALRRRAKGYNQRVNAHLPTLEYFSQQLMSIFRRRGAPQKQQEQEIPELKSESSKGDQARGNCEKKNMVMLGMTEAPQYGFDFYDNKASVYHVVNKCNDFSKYKDEHGAFKEPLARDVEEMLGLYEATYMK
ncbi:beta-caryophyllene synthase-like protein, partial [Tanacetum coccineum]